MKDQAMADKVMTDQAMADKVMTDKAVKSEMKEQAYTTWMTEFI